MYKLQKESVSQEAVLGYFRQGFTEAGFPNLAAMQGPATRWLRSQRRGSIPGWAPAILGITGHRTPALPAAAE